MTPDQPPLKPVEPTRVAREITKLSAERRSGQISEAVYDQRFARMIGELRERRIAGTRADLVAALKPLMDQGAITDAEWQRLVTQLGLV